MPSTRSRVLRSAGMATTTDNTATGSTTTPTPAGTPPAGTALAGAAPAGADAAPVRRTALPGPYLLWLAGAHRPAGRCRAPLRAGLGRVRPRRGRGGPGADRDHAAAHRPGAAGRRGGGPAGLCTASAGIAVLAWSPGVPAAVAGGVVAGAGSGLFACRLGPLVLGSAPAGHLSRVQALLTLVQSAALVLSTGLLGVLADVAGARPPMVLCALAAGAAGFAALTSAALRRVRRMPLRGAPRSSLNGSLGAALGHGWAGPGRGSRRSGVLAARPAAGQSADRGVGRRATAWPASGHLRPPSGVRRRAARVAERRIAGRRAPGGDRRRR